MLTSPRIAQSRLSTPAKPWFYCFVDETLHEVGSILLVC